MNRRQLLQAAIAAPAVAALPPSPIRRRTIGTLVVRMRLEEYHIVKAWQDALRGVQKFAEHI